MASNPNRTSWPGGLTLGLLTAVLCATAFAFPNRNDSGPADQYRRRGVELFARRQPAKAAAQLQRSLELDPGQPKVLKLLGLCYELTKKTGKAEEAFRRASKLAPKDPEAWFFLGRVYYSANFFDKAHQALTTAAEFSPRGPRIHNYLGLTLEAMGRIDEALREYREAIKWNERKRVPSFRPYYSYGVLLSKLNRLREGERQLLRARQLDPAVWETHFELAKLHYKQGKLDAALEELNSALKIVSPRRKQAAQLYHLQARVYFKMGRKQEAQQALATLKKLLQ